MIKDKSAVSDPERRYAFMRAVAMVNGPPQPPRASGIRYGRTSSSRGWLKVVVERSRYAAERRDRLAKLGRLLYPISHASAQLFPRFSLAQEAEIEYNPHFLGGV
jgi:hypothetical protein